MLEVVGVVLKVGVVPLEPGCGAEVEATILADSVEPLGAEVTEAELVAAILGTS